MGNLYLIESHLVGSSLLVQLGIPLVIDARLDADLEELCQEAGIGYHPVGDRLHRSETAANAVLGEIVHLLADGMAGLVADGYDAVDYCRPAPLARRLGSLGVTVLDVAPDGSTIVHQPDFGF